MPAVTPSDRDKSIGRFPSVTLGFEEKTAERDEESVESDVSNENACQRWLRKTCWCCYSKRKDDDITETVVTDDPDKHDGKNEPSTDGNDQLDELLLKVLSVDLMKIKSGANRTEHHTNFYEGDNFIIRRGQTFQMWVTLSRPFDPNRDKLHFELKTGPLPTVSKGTHVIVPVVEEQKDGRWEAAVVEQDDKRIRLSVNSSPKAVIGRYQLTVETNCASGQHIFEHDPANDIYMLFNPWCKDDSVFLYSEEERKEYVLNDVGRIYYGDKDHIGARTWDYGQFTDGILATCLFVLEKSGTPRSGWGDPVNVVRIISAMINNPDDGGVLEGNWSGDYSGGTSPTLWLGSVEILQKYYKSNGLSVKYGQCWVFAGVVTTGIPSRTVTNFESAHDTDVSLTTDVYIDENLNSIEELNTDSIWNFHVWNDCWMARPDLPDGYGGWQAVDATPQETSQGIYCCGPASLAAVRDGHVYLKYDCPFVFAEVNSDKIYWQRQADGTFVQFLNQKRAVGHHISTKAVGSDERSDITHLYKEAEGSDEERLAVERACRYGSLAKAFPSPTVEDVSVEVIMQEDGPKMGRDVDLTIKLKNISSEERNIRLHSHVAVMYYTGVYKATVKRDTTELDLQPNRETILEWSLDYEVYKSQLIDQAALMLTLFGKVKETEQILGTQFSFRLRTPDVTIKPIGKAAVGEKMAVEISFTNPLPEVLKAVIFNVEGLGLLPARKIAYGDIGGHATITLTEGFVPSLPGTRKLLASLDCKQLTQVHGVSDVTVEDKGNAAPQ